MPHHGLHTFRGWVVRKVNYSSKTQLAENKKSTVHPVFVPGVLVLIEFQEQLDVKTKETL